MSGERFTLDTNVLVYSIDSGSGHKHAIARQLVERAVRSDCWLTLQAVSEFYAAATRKRLLGVSEAAIQARDWLTLFPCLPASATAVASALAAATGHRSYWDHLLIATAAEAGCTAILTEDLDDSSTLGGVQIVNPFGQDRLTDRASALLEG